MHDEEETENLLFAAIANPTEKRAIVNLAVVDGKTHGTATYDELLVEERLHDIDPRHRKHAAPAAPDLRRD